MDETLKIILKDHQPKHSSYLVECGFQDAVRYVLQRTDLYHERVLNEHGYWVTAKEPSPAWTVDAVVTYCRQAIIDQQSKLDTGYHHKSYGDPDEDRPFHEGAIAGFEWVLSMAGLKEEKNE